MSKEHDDSASPNPWGAPTDYDEADNPIWEAASPYNDIGPWRLSMILEDGRVKYTLDTSPAELVEFYKPTRFGSMEEAWDFVAQDHAEAREHATGNAAMNFSDALKEMRNGRAMRRRGWNGPGQFVMMQRPNGHSKMSEPYCYLKNAQGGRVPWVPSQGDLFAEDWELAE